MKNALNNQVGMLGDMFLWIVANLKLGVIYFIKQALPPNKSAGSVYVPPGFYNYYTLGLLRETFTRGNGLLFSRSYYCLFYV